MSVLLAATGAELSKIRSSRIVWLITAAVIALHLLIGLANMRDTTTAVEGITPDGLIEIFAGERRPAGEALIDLLLSFSLQIVVMFLPIIAAVIAGQEFRDGQLAQSVLAVPRRGLLTVAKTIALVVFTAGVAILVELISNAYLFLAVKDWNPGLLLGRNTLAEHGELLALAVLVSLVSFAITTLTRSTLIGIVLSLLLMALAMTQVLARTVPVVDALLPVSAGRNLLLDPADADLSSSAGYAAVVLVAWALLSTLAAGLLLSRRDAR
ncbi:ABC transporter permease [Micromonospora sp. DT53]|uniref:ABC transporter permease n=1 Tax=Micromonospora sp. DT53 TaxID=3393444 RepID=UPI003CFA31FE